MLSGICCAAITSIEIANANAASMNVSSRVICIPRNRNPCNRGNESRSAGTADAISSWRPFICWESYAKQHCVSRDFSSPGLIPLRFSFFCKASGMRASSQHESGIAVLRFCRTFYSARRRCGSALEDSAPNQSARYSSGDAQSTSRGPGAGGQAFWKRRCFSGSNAGRATWRSSGNR